MDSNLSVEDFQTDIDFGKRDLLSQGDILVFGVLGGWVHGDLDVGGVNRQFDMSGAQAGAYAAYLKGGLFVLFKADVSQARAAGSGVSERTRYHELWRADRYRLSLRQFPARPLH